MANQVNSLGKQWKSVRQSQELARFPVRFTHNGKPGRTATPNLQARPVLHGV
jgi:hypothetical protein